MQQLTLGQIIHLLSWGSAVRHKYQWHSSDEKMEDFLQDYKKKILRERYLKRKQNATLQSPKPFGQE